MPQDSNELNSIQLPVTRFRLPVSGDRKLVTFPQICLSSRHTFCFPFMIKYTTPFLTKLEELINESDHVLRYEKGNFKSGYCVLKDQKIIIVNKFYTTEGKINALLDILKNVALDTSNFSEKNQKLYEELTQTEVKA